jgi:hypothetical protein
MADDYSKWKLVPVSPAAPDVSGWKLQAAPPSGFTGARADTDLPLLEQAQRAAPAFVRGVAQGGSLGFGDEIQGAMAAGAQFLGAHPLAQRIATGQLFVPTKDLAFQPAEDAHHQPLSPLDAYRAMRDADREENASAAQGHLPSYIAGNLVGAIATAKPVSAVGEALPLMKGTRLGRVLAQGVIPATIASAGASNADTASGLAKDAIGISGAEQAAQDFRDGNGWRGAPDLLGSGALGGLGAGTVAELASPLARALGSKIQDFGTQTAKRAIYNVTNGLAARRELSDSAAQAALGSGAVRLFGTAHGTAERLADVAAREGERLDNAIQTLESAGVRAPADPITARLGAEAASARANSINPAVPKVYSKTAAQLGGLATADQPFGLAQAEMGQTPSPTLGIGQLENLKRSAQATARKAYESLRDTEVGNAQKGLASILRQANEDAVSQAKLGATLGSPVDLAADDFLEAKHRLADLLPARNEAEIGAARGGRRSLLGLAGHEMMAEGLKSGDAVEAGKSLAAALANSLFHHIGPSTLAASSYGLGKALRLGAPLLDSPNARALVMALQRSQETAAPRGLVRVLDPVTGQELGRSE